MPPGGIPNDEFYKMFNESALKGGQRVVVSKETTAKVGGDEIKTLGDFTLEEDGVKKKEKKKHKKREEQEKIIKLTREIEARKEKEKPPARFERENIDFSGASDGLKKALAKKREIEAVLEKKEIKTELPKRLSTSEGAVSSQVLSLDIIRRIIDSPEGEKIIIGGVEKNLDLSLLDEEDNSIENKSGENFKALVKYFWRLLGTHGVVDEEREFGKIEGDKFPLRLKSKSDLDGQVCLELMRRVGIKTKEGARFVYAGKELKGSLTLDSSEKRADKKSDGLTTVYEEVVVGGTKKWLVTTVVDHHSEESRSDSSASKYVYEGLIKLGLIEKSSVLDKLVDFTTHADNGVPPKEMIEVMAEYNEKNKIVLTKKEFLLQKWGDTAWALKRFVKLPRLIDFLDKGGDPTKVLDQKSEDFKRLGVIYPDNKSKAKKIINLREKLQENIESSLSALEEIERGGMVLVSEKYGNIVIDRGGKMAGLGSQMCRDLGYDGYVSWKPEENSFAVWTRKPLEEKFSQGFKLREFMWVKKSKLDGDLKMTLGDVTKALKGNDKDTVWSHGLEESVRGETKGNEEKKEEKKPVWDDQVLRDLDIATLKSNKDEVRDAAWKRLNDRGFLLKASQGEDKEFFDAINVALSHRGDFKGAEKFLKEYFGVGEGEEKKEEVNKKEWTLEKLNELIKIDRNSSQTRVEQMRVIREMVEGGCLVMSHVQNASPDRAKAMVDRVRVAMELLEKPKLRETNPAFWEKTKEFFRTLGLEVV